MSYNNKVYGFGQFVGSTIQSVNGMDEGSDRVTIVTDRGTLLLYHEQDCCESVNVTDVTGDPADIVGGVVTVAEERDDAAPEGYVPDRYAESETWTFYEIRTTKGDVTIRWLGSSNGYYSEAVTVEWASAVSP